MSFWVRLAIYVIPKDTKSAQKMAFTLIIILAIPILLVFILFNPRLSGHKDEYDNAYEEIGCPVVSNYILEDIRAFDSYADMDAYENMSKDEAKKRLKEIYLNITNSPDGKKCYLKSDIEIKELLKNKFKLSDKTVNEMMDNVNSIRNGRQTFTSPLKQLQIERAYDEILGYTIFSSDSKASVLSIGNGKVLDIHTYSEKVNINEKVSSQKGLTIKIEYESNKGMTEEMEYKTEKVIVHYAMLSNAKVNVGDEVTNGQEIAQLSSTYLYTAFYDKDDKKMDSSAYLYLGNQSSGKFIVPFKQFKSIISEVGQRSLDDFHYGMDMDGGRDGEVLAFTDATVIRTATSCAPFGGSLGNKCPADDSFAWGAGNYVMIGFKVDSKEYYALYGHLSKVYVYVGDKVVSGDLIGLQGSSGNSSGTHLHLEVHEGTYQRSPVASKKGLTDPRKFIDFEDGKKPQEFH